MASIAVSRVWHGADVPLVRWTLTRPLTNERLVLIDALCPSLVRARHGTFVLEIAPLPGADAPIFCAREDARVLLMVLVRATPALLDRLLSDAFTWRRHAMLAPERADDA